MQPDAKPSRNAPDVPPFIDENPNLEAVRQGLNVAENETREAAGNDPATDEPDAFSEDASEEPIAPEVSAIRTEI